MNPELVVLTTYFNPCRYQRRRANYNAFMDGMRRAKVQCITIECAFGTDAFELEPALDVIQVRANTLLWQKERLLNMGASWLPRGCKYVAWLDCDILFDRTDWPALLVSTLRKHKVAQVFETCIRLDKDGSVGQQPDLSRSFAAMMIKSPALLDAGRYDSHGHTGYGWAMRREIFDAVGLYEAAVSGSADHFMAHAIYGDYNFCIRNALKQDEQQIDHLKSWGARFHAIVNGSLGVVPGNIRHLWHGDKAHRRYFLRMHDITDLGFNPWTDLHISPGSPLEWAHAMNKPKLRQYFAQYFASRLEDGLPT